MPVDLEGSDGPGLRLPLRPQGRGRLLGWAPMLVLEYARHLRGAAMGFVFWAAWACNSGSPSSVNSELETSETGAATGAADTGEGDESLPESTRTAIAERAQAAFAELEDEIEKQRQ